MKVDFEKFKVYTSIRKDSTMLVDVKEQTANMLYMNMPGIKPAALAMKIYNAEGPVELTDEEVGIIDVMMSEATGPMRDGWNELKTLNK